MGLVGFKSTVGDMVGRQLRKHVGSFCFLETNGGPNIIVGRDGSLMSMIHIDGVKRVMGRKEMQDTVDSLTSSLGQYFQQSGHALQVSFMRDPDIAPALVRKHNQSPRRVAKYLDLRLDDVMNEKEAFLPQHVVGESYQMTLWTRMSVLPPKDAKDADKKRAPPAEWPPTGDAQDVFRIAEAIVEKHKSFVTNFLQDLLSVEIRARLMTAHETVASVRTSLNPSTYGAEWRACLQGDPIPLRRPEISGADASHMLWPRLESQICTQEAERIDGTVVRMGDRLFGGIDMTVGPQELQPFSNMIHRMRMSGTEFPWRVSFLIEGDGLAGTALKSSLAMIFGWSSGKNKAISSALKALKDLRDKDGAVLTALRTSFATWAPSDRPELINERVSRLVNIVQSWGHCQTSSLAGDPLACMMSSVSGIAPMSTAPAGVVPLDSVISMLPLDRDASPWANGSVIFRTLDGRTWPFVPGSTLQDAWNNIIVGVPGRGKSVLLNTLSMAFCLSAQATLGQGGAKLPRISILDIGFSSKGLISLIKEALPANRKHEAEHLTLRNDRSNAINFLGTQLGCRRPFPLERRAMINMLVALGTSEGAEGGQAPEGLAELCGAVLDELFVRFSDENPKSSPKLYENGVDLVVDEAIQRHGIPIDRNTWWWTVVDRLADHGAMHQANLAQRHAVPLIHDIAPLLKDKKITNIHGGALIRYSENLIENFTKMMLSAPQDYPLLSAPTKFDVGEARVVALDLSQIAGNSGQASKSTGLVYMLGRYVLANDFFFDEEMVDLADPQGRFVPKKYRDYHLERIRRMGETPKMLVYDEFHQTRLVPAVREQVKHDMRVVRKYNVQISLASQLVDDFDDEMIQLASGKWILGFNSRDAAEQCQRRFKLTDTACNIIAKQLNGPKVDGAPFLLVVTLKDGEHEHHLCNTIGPVESWAFNTDAKDVTLRERLYTRLGASESRRRLAKMFPNGARHEIQDRILSLVNGGENRDEAENGVIQEFVDRVFKAQV